MKHEKPSKAKIADGQISAEFDREALTRAVKIASTGEECRKGSSVPVLTYLVVGPAAVEHRGVDASVHVRLKDCEGSGRVLLPARSLAGALSAMSAETVRVTKAEGDAAVTLSCGDVVASFVPYAIADAAPPVEVSPTMLVKEKDQPPVEVSSEIRTFSLGEGALGALLRFVSPFISQEETRYYLNGVALRCSDAAGGPTLCAVATDGHRLGFTSVGLSSPCDPFSPRILPRPAEEFLRQHVGRDETRIRISARHAEIAFGDVTLTTKLIDGTYPDYTRVIPAPSEVAMTLDCVALARFLSGARRMLGWGRSAFGCPAVKLERTDEALRVSSKNPDNHRLETTIAIEADGDPTRGPIGFNPSYLGAIAKVFSAKRLRLELADPGSPCRISDPDAPGERFVVLMPMRV